ncbi:MAG: hypothetical protein HZA01_05600 [Nitrospinae bacterium]|nr:hypothetical protein [Nitrospinota bacterium]
MLAENILRKLEEFRIARFEFILASEEHIELPEYKGSALRGGFGTALRKVLCDEKKNNCDDCSRKKDCLFLYLFNTRLPEGSEVLKNTKNIPAPFVIEPPLENKRIFAEGEEIIFNLVLIGKARNYLPHFIFAFEEFGRAGLGKGGGRFLLKSVSRTDKDGITKTVFKS